MFERVEGTREGRVGETAYRRVGEWACRRMVGRKSRRAPDGPSRLRVSAPDLSCALDIRSPEARSDPRTRAKLDGTPHPDGSNPTRFSQQGGLPLSAPRFSPYHAHPPTRPLADTPTRPHAHTPTRPHAPPRLALANINKIHCPRERFRLKKFREAQVGE